MMNVIFKRVSIRRYKKQTVNDDKIEKLLRAAMAAPSAGNQQPWEFYVVRDKVLLEQLAICSEYAGCAAKAPVAIVTCYNKERLLMSEYATIDMSAAVENILLEAVDQGLGAVWLGIAPIAERMQKVKSVLNMPEELEAFAIIPVGYSDEERTTVERFETERVHYV